MTSLEPTLLIAEKEPQRFGRAAVRWHARFALEAKGLDLPESHLALALIAALPRDGTGAAREALRRLAARYGING